MESPKDNTSGHPRGASIKTHSNAFSRRRLTGRCSRRTEEGSILKVLALQVLQLFVASYIHIVSLNFKVTGEGSSPIFMQREKSLKTKTKKINKNSPPNQIANFLFAFVHFDLLFGFFFFLAVVLCEASFKVPRCL